MTVLRPAAAAPPPLNLDLFGSLGSVIEKLAEQKGASPDLTALAMLTAASAMIGVKRRASPWRGWAEPAILWGAAIMPPSQNKSPALDPFRDALRHAEQRQSVGFGEEQRKYEAKKLAAEIARDAWDADVREAVTHRAPPPPLPPEAEAPKAPVRPRLWTADITAQQAARLMMARPGNILVYRDELAGWIGSFGQFSKGAASDRAFWLECYGGRPYRVDRVGDGELDVPFIAASILGAITPDGVSTLILSGERDGFAARFLFIWPAPVKPKRPSGESQEAVLHRIFGRLGTLQMDAGTTGEFIPRAVPLACDAVDLFENWRNQHYLKIDTAHGLHADALGKQPGLALRLANVLEHLKWAALEQGAEPAGIGVETLNDALQLVDTWITPHLERVLGEASLPKSDDNAAVLALWLLKNPCASFNASYLRRRETKSLSVLRQAKDMDDACTALVAAGWLLPAGTRAGDRRGRMSKDFDVNPLIYAQAEEMRNLDS